MLADRYHARLLRSPSEVRRVVAYVRDNHRKHMASIGRPLAAGYVDPYSSEGGALVLPRPETWALRACMRPP
jgi:hypothetical protein